MIADFIPVRGEQYVCHTCRREALRHRWDDGWFYCTSCWPGTRDEWIAVGVCAAVNMYGWSAASAERFAAQWGAFGSAVDQRFSAAVAVKRCR